MIYQVSAFAIVLLSFAGANDNLRIAFQWKQIDFEFPSEEAKQEAINNREFVPENNVPVGLEVYGDRLFLTVPRWKSGVAASLTYINLTGWYCIYYVSNFIAEGTIQFNK